jgi:shikimate dehydrogenase
MSAITSTTRTLGVIGWPVEHSLSPAMHNAALRHLGLDWVYLPFAVRPERVGEAVGGVRGLGLVGLNVTIPHKAAVLPYLDEATPEVWLLGACNTIINEDGHLRGENTDAEGFLRAVAEAGGSLAGRAVVVIGAGGSARAVALAALKTGAASLTIANRTLDRAEEMAALLAPVAGATPLRALALRDPQTADAVRAAQVVVDCTSVGMYPRHEVPPVVPAEWLRPGQLVCDLTYNPRRTALLRAAHLAGATPLEGTGMLVHQGALSLEKWTAQPAPLEIMRRALLQALES